MFRASAWKGGIAAAALAAVALLLVPGAIAQDQVSPEHTVSMTQAWAEDRVDRAENQAEELTEDKSGEEQQGGEEPSTEESEPTPQERPNQLQTWLEAEVAETLTEVNTLAHELNRESERRVQETVIMVASVTALASDEEAETETQATATEEVAPIPAAVVVATVAAAATAGTMFIMFWTAGSTAGTAGSAAAGAKSGSAGLKKVAPIFSPLFTRFEGREVLKHPNRQQLYTLVAANPGVRLQDLCEETTLSRTAVTHHLRLLENQHLIVSERVGRSRHYYENGGRYEREKKEAYAVLQNDRSRDIAKMILAEPGIIQKNLCETLGMRASIAHWHIKRLQEASLVDCVRQGRTVSYYPAGNLNGLSF